MAGGVSGAYVGCSGGTVVLPLIGTATGCVGGAVLGAAGGFVGGVFGSVVTQLMSTCTR